MKLAATCRNLLLIASMGIFIALPAHAQTNPKLPRVLEIERMLQNDIQGTLRDIIPGQSFSVKVTIDPLRRNSARSAASKESLPYYDGNEEIIDEWDDPAKSEFELLARVNRITVRALVPDSVSLEQKNELRTAILSRIPFVEGRDSVEVEVRAWNDNSKDPSRYNRWILGMGIALMFIMGLVSLFISWIMTNRLSKAIRNIKVTTSDSNSGSAMPHLSAAANTSPPPGGHGFGSGQVQLNDTLRMNEVILGLIKQFETSESFPSLDDMILLEEYFKQSPSSTGGLLAEFPSAIRNRLFSLSFSNDWLKGYTNPSDVDPSAFELMNKLVRIERDHSKTNWNELLIACWRLDADLVPFLKSIDGQDSLSILKALPQSIAIRAARDLMPGEWAAVMKRSGPVREMMPDRIEKYRHMAVALKPLRSFGQIEQYRKDVDLIKYLQIVDPTFEKEIYGAAPEDSALSQLRPPFFPVLDATPEILTEFVSQVSLDDWALALMNVPRSSRVSIEANFNEKQKYRLTELLKRNDRAALSAEIIGSARERVGKYFAVFSEQRAHKLTAPLPGVPAREAA